MGEDSAKNLEILASDPTNKVYFLSTATTKTDLDPTVLAVDENGDATKAPGFHPLTPDQQNAVDQKIADIHHRLPGRNVAPDQETPYR